MIEKPIYFKGLNGVRAIAALIVLACHIDQFSRLFNVDKIGFHENGMAGYAVDMFFVLSGYLITYLLLAEKEKTKSVALKKFYLRRIFRIWPLYYLSMAVALILLYFNVGSAPDEIMTSVGLYTFFAANIAFVTNLAITSIAQLWSVGVEEQFYLLWPHLIKRGSNYLVVIILFYFFFVFLKLLAYLIFSPESAIYFFMAYSSLNIMCMGAVGAFLVYFKKPVLSVVYRKDVQLVAWLVLIYSCCYKPLHLFTFIDQELNSIFYLTIIINVSTNNNSLVSLENKWMNYLGKISYGIYMYHMLIIFLLARLVSDVHIEINYIGMESLVAGLTILVAAISYRYFETPFLKMKESQSIVQTTSSESAA